MIAVTLILLYLFAEGLVSSQHSIVFVSHCLVSRLLGLFLRGCRFDFHYDKIIFALLSYAVGYAFLFGLLDYPCDRISAFQETNCYLFAGWHCNYSTARRGRTPCLPQLVNFHLSNFGGKSRSRKWILGGVTGTGMLTAGRLLKAGIYCEVMGFFRSDRYPTPALA